MHLQLYNAYLTLAELAPAEEKPSLVDQSADHLFAALDLPIKEKNQFWLANHYFQRYQNCSEEKKAFYLERSIAVLENLLGVSELSAMAFSAWCAKSSEVDVSWA